MSADCRLTLTVRPARDAAEVEAAMDLRVRVFCDEQGVDREAELDGLDDEATQIVALDQRGVIATCRLRFVDGDCKLERMAVERRHRGGGAGGRLLEAAEDEARHQGASVMLLDAQRRAEGFYAAAGYRAEGEPFMEEGIEHVRMSKPMGEGGKQ
ncbi:MAG: GNAT family N-acetyltransferase [Solirubrobacterales bacterium]